MDWKQQALDTLRRYPAQRAALQNLPREQERVQLEMDELRRTEPQGAGRQQLLERALELQAMRRREKRIRLEVEAVQTALEVLGQNERLVLEELVMAPDADWRDICDRVGLERSALYACRTRALKQFMQALRGVGER